MKPQNYPSLLPLATGLLLLTACSPKSPGTTGQPGEPAAESAAGEPAAVVEGVAEIPGIKLPAYRETRLDNGVLLVLMEKRDVPLIAFTATLRGGVIAEPGDRNGVASLTAALLEKGAGERDAREFADTVASVGGEFGVSAGLESISISGEFMARDTALMIELLADVLRRPRLQEDEFDKLRTRAIQSIAAAKDADPRALIHTYAHAFLHQEHPYGRPVDGSEESLARVTHRDVLDFHASQIGADRLQLTVVGDFDATDMAQSLTAALDGWPGATAQSPEVPGPRKAPGGRVLLVDKPDATQTYFWIGNLGVSETDPDKAAIDIANTLFGGRFTSMLNSALRIESGLTYGARSRLSRHSLPGSVAMVSYTATESTVEAMDMALDQLAKLHADGFDETLVTSGKTYIRGTFPLRLETNPQLAGALARLKLFGLPDEAISGYASAIGDVSGDKIAGVIERVYPKGDGLVFVLIGNGEAIREKVTKYGEVEEIEISAPHF